MSTKNIILVALIFLWIVFTSSCFGFFQAQSQEKFPLKLSEGGLIFVEVQAQDSVKGTFILDTGAGIHVLSNRFFHKLQSKPAGFFTGFRHTGERIGFDLFEIPSFNIGPFRQQHPLVGTWALLDSFHIDGIVSLKFFENHPFTIDFKSKQLVFENQNSLGTLKSKGAIVPLRIHSDRGKSLDVFADFMLNDSIKIECIVDTGSPADAIDYRYMQFVGFHESSSGVQRKESKSILGNTEYRYETRLSSISLFQGNAIRVKDHKVSFKKNLIYDGLIGTDFWKGRRVTFNIAEKYLIVNSD